MKRLLLMLLAVAAVAGMAIGSDGRTASAASGEVVFLESADVGFGAGNVAASFGLAGKTVVYKSPADWAAMTTADFADYDAIVLPDPTCAGSLTPIAAAIVNASTWGAAVDGNVIVIGTDEQFHNSASQGRALSDAAAAFVVADAGKTGAYVSLGCYYDGTAPGTPEPMLDAAFGGTFTVTGVPGCFNDAHIVATHPAMSGLTDANLSNWSCSVHEAFDGWPVNFEVLAIALTGSAYNAPDGTVGTPYILARGVEVISDIDLFPADAINELGESHELTAVVTTDDPVAGTPVVGTTVTFTIVAGPHAGVIGSAVTDGTGTATISYTGTILGTDTIEATFVDALGRTQRSNRVTKTWASDDPGPEPTPTPEPGAGGTCYGRPVTIWGTDGDDVIFGTNGADVIHGLDGDDEISGLSGNDVICGGNGDDTLSGGSGNDVILSGEGDDWADGGTGKDLVDGGPGDDFLIGGDDHDWIWGEPGNDILMGKAGQDIMSGGEGDDILYGDSNQDILNGGVGNDELYGGSGQDILNGGEDDDSLFGESNQDILNGDVGNDSLDGDGGFDLCNGGIDSDSFANCDQESDS